jgi:hypothetical protein
MVFIFFSVSGTEAVEADDSSFLVKQRFTTVPDWLLASQFPSVLKMLSLFGYIVI